MNSATSSYAIFIDKLENKGYRVERDGVVFALKTPYKVLVDESSRVVVQSPAWNGTEWSYTHGFGRMKMGGESFVRMIPNKLKQDSNYLDREIEEVL